MIELHSTVKVFRSETFVSKHRHWWTLRHIPNGKQRRLGNLKHKSLHWMVLFVHDDDHHLLGLILRYKERIFERFCMQNFILTQKAHIASKLQYVTTNMASASHSLSISQWGVKGWLFVWHHWHNNITDFDQKCQNYEVLPSSQFSKPWRKCSISVFSYLAMLWSQLPFRWVVSHSEECPEYTDSAQGGRTSRQLEQIVQVRTKAMGWLNVLIWWYTFSVKLYIPQIRAKCCSSQTHVPEQGRCISFSSERFLMGTPLGRTGWDVWRPPETHIRYLPPL